MRTFIFVAALLISIASAWSAPLIPTKQGTTWQYDVTDEAGGQSAPEHSQIHYRINGTQEFAGKELLKLETFVGDVAIKTELVDVGQNGIRSFAHTGKDGNMIGFISPQTIVPAKLKKGASWDCIDEIADVRVHQHFTVADTENVSVPAGDFHALRLHCEESAPMSVTIDRWFVDGVGFVKEITTLRSPTGDLLHRRTLELAKLPALDASRKDRTEKLSVGVSRQRIGAFEKEFSERHAKYLRALARAWIAREFQSARRLDRRRCRRHRTTQLQD